MKKIVLAFVLLMSIGFMSLQVSAVPSSCEISPEFCIVDPGDGGGTGDPTVPDYYLVNTGLVAQVVTSGGYFVGFYLIYVKAADIAVDLNTSDIYFRNVNNYGSFYTSAHIIQRDPWGGITTGGSYWLAPGITGTYFQTYDVASGMVAASGFTVLVESAWGGRTYFDGDTTGFNYASITHGYYNTTTEEFLISYDDGMDGSLGRYVFGKVNSYGNYVDTHILGWGILNSDGSDIVIAYTNYDNYYSLPVSYDLSILEDYVIVNR